MESWNPEGPEALPTGHGLWPHQALPGREGAPVPGSCEDLQAGLR